MATPDFSVKKDDLKPVLTATLTDSTGAAIDLTGQTVNFIMKRAGASSNKVDASATIVDAATGQVSYTWTGTDTDTAGHYYAWWLINYTAAPLSVPNSHPPIWIEVYP